MKTLFIATASLTLAVMETSHAAAQEPNTSGDNAWLGIHSASTAARHRPSQ